MFRGDDSLNEIFRKMYRVEINRHVCGQDTKPGAEYLQSVSLSLSLSVSVSVSVVGVD